MSLETPPPPPPPPPSSDGDANSQAPKLKLNKPLGAPVPPPPPSAAIPPPPPATAIPRPPSVGATAPRVAPTFSSTPSSNVTALAASFDVIGMLASTAAFVFLLIELFFKTKG